MHPARTTAQTPSTPEQPSLALPQPSLYNTSSGRSSPIFLADPSGAGASIGPGAKDFSPQAQAVAAERENIEMVQQEMHSNVVDNLRTLVRELDTDAWQYDPVDI